MSFSPGQSPPAFRSPPRHAGNGPGTPPTSRGIFTEYDERPRNGGRVAEPDETTRIVTRDPGAPCAMNYQSTATSDTNRARARKNGTTTRKSTGNGRGHDENGPDAGEDQEQDKEATTWWKQQLAKFGSIELENKGSVARDHLALGRWF